MPAKFLVGVSVLLEHAGKVLLLHRAGSKDHGAGEWEPISGRMEQGETAEQAAVREVKEETGLDAKIIMPFDTFFFVRKPSNEELVGITFCAKAFSDAVTLSEEHDQYKWVPKAELTQQTASAPVKNALAKYVALKIE